MTPGSETPVVSGISEKGSSTRGRNLSPEGLHLPESQDLLPVPLLCRGSSSDIQEGLGDWNGWGPCVQAVLCFLVLGIEPEPWACPARAPPRSSLNALKLHFLLGTLWRPEGIFVRSLRKGVHPPGDLWARCCYWKMSSPPALPQHLKRKQPLCWCGLGRHQAGCPDGSRKGVEEPTPGLWRLESVPRDLSVLRAPDSEPVHFLCLLQEF